MTKINIFSVSINPESYDVRSIANMTYDEAKQFFEHDDTNCCCCCRNIEVDQTKEHEITFHADGVRNGDGSDTMFNWLKVVNE